MTTTEVSVWINGAQKWVTGVTRRTTCAELVRVLLSAEMGSSATLSDSELRSYALFECWRQVERPLNGTDRILKVLKAWGETGVEEVQFTLKRVGPQTPKDLKTQRRRHHTRSRWRSSSSLDTLHPRRLAAETSDGQNSEVVERLMKMIIVQGETIQAQLKRLREREDVISRYEHRLHQSRVEQLGSDYLLKTYLKDGELEETEKKSNDSGVLADIVATEAERGAAESAVSDSNRLADANPSLDDLRSSIHYLGRIAEINSRLVDHEEQCVKLGHKIRRSQISAEEVISSGKEAENEELLELEVSRAELQRLANLCERQQTEMQQAERESVKHERLLEDRRCYLQYLEYELAVADEEEDRLNAQLALQQQDEQQELSKSTGQHVAIRELFTDNTTHCLSRSSKIQSSSDKFSADKLADSNSDTGLSSLDSSGDETATHYMLETLV